MPYGLTPTGFVPKTYEIVVDEIKGALTDYFGASLDLENGVLARLIAIFAERIAELWELAEAVNSSQDVDKATAAALDALCLLAGTFRLAAAPSTVVLTLTGTPTAVVPADSRASATSTGARFATVSSVTIEAATAWAPSTGYSLGQRRTSSSKIYEVITAGTSGLTGPSAAFPDVTDGTVHWVYLGAGTGYVDADATSVDTGPVTATAGDITTIETPVGGWSGVYNKASAEPGYDVQADEALRVSREEELSQSGTSTADAIRAALLALDGTSSVTVFENETDVTDGDGVPPHSVEVLVRGGDDVAIAEVLLDQVAAGIGTHGNTSAVAVDSEGNSHTIYFSRPVEINIGVAVTLIKDPSTYPADGDAQVEAAIVAFGAAQRCGKNAVASSIGAQAFKIAGVLDVTDVDISSNTAPLTPPAPTVSTTISIAPRELAVFSDAWITVTTSDGTP